jgi:phage shock protein C
MQARQPSLIARDDTLFGVCQAIGEDFGFNPLPLRIAFAVSLLWNPSAVLAIYAALAVVVMLSRWLAPNPRPERQPASREAAAVPASAPDGREPELLAA